MAALAMSKTLIFNHTALFICSLKKVTGAAELPTSLLRQDSHLSAEYRRAELYILCF
jgi:hypothetical protein